LHGEYAVLKKSAGLVSFDADGILSIQGRDRVAWLHKLVTVNIEVLAQGSGAYGLLLNGSAHVLADFIVLAESDSFLLYSSSRAKEGLFAQLRRSLFREQVTINRLDELLGVLSVQGPRSREVMDFAFDSLPALEPFQFSRNGESLIIRNSRAGEEGYDLFVPRVQLAEIRGALIRRGAREISQDALNIARIEAGIAWYGDDFDDTMLALEARLEPHIADNKGCYPGQEVIARIHNRGHVNRLLVQLLFEGKTIPRRGDLLFSGDREVGWITSPTWSFAHNAPLALGYLRREMAQKGTRVQVAHEGDGIEAQVVGP
jgi:folate-binding protein YgfZ